MGSKITLRIISHFIGLSLFRMTTNFSNFEWLHFNFHEKKFFKINFRFRLKGQKTRHERTHTGERPFACLQCGARFADTTNLQSHKRIHTGERPFVCEHCHKGFSQKQHLKVRLSLLLRLLLEIQITRYIVDMKKSNSTFYSAFLKNSNNTAKRCTSIWPTSQCCPLWFISHKSKVICK